MASGSMPPSPDTCACPRRLTTMRQLPSTLPTTSGRRRPASLSPPASSHRTDAPHESLPPDTAPRSHCETRGGVPAARPTEAARSTPRQGASPRRSCHPSPPGPAAPTPRSRRSAPGQKPFPPRCENRRLLRFSSSRHSLLSQVPWRTGCRRDSCLRFSGQPLLRGIRACPSMGSGRAGFLPLSARGLVGGPFGEHGNIGKGG